MDVDDVVGVGASAAVKQKEVAETDAGPWTRVEKASPSWLPESVATIHSSIHTHIHTQRDRDGHKMARAKRQNQ